MPHYKLGSDIPHQPIPSNVNVAIVGAGMSGLYSAWRLQNEAQIEDLAIFERSDRTGGRLDSDLIHFKNPYAKDDEPKVTTLKEEQGGMRFLFDGMDNLMALFLTLDLQDQIVPFPMNSGGNNRLFFRGTSFSVNQAKEADFDIWSQLYNLSPSEQNVNPKDIINVVFNRILQANPQFDSRPEVRGPEFWQNFRLDCKWKGNGLNNWTLWDLFSDMGYSQECITMLYRVLGFNGTFLSQMNAGVAYQLLEDFPANVRFRTFKDGFSTLPNALVDAFGKDKIHLQSSIEEIDYDSVTKKYVLSYLHTDTNGVSTKGLVHADKVILALPRLALERLLVKSNAFNKLPKDKFESLWDTLQSTSNQPLLKINLYYKTPWWSEGISGRPSVEFGPNFADLPTGSVYPFYTVSEPLAASLMYAERETDAPEAVQKKLDDINQSKYQYPAALTIYCDYLNINFWDTLQSKGTPYTNPQANEYIEDIPCDIYPATESVVEQATTFFKQIFDTHYVPDPIVTSARIWQGSVKFDLPASQKFGYGVHQWAVGANDRQVITDMTEVLPNLYTCGEAFSDYQGWVEGALRSADLVLKKGFFLQPLNDVYKQQTNVCSSQAITAAYEKNATALIKKYVDSRFDIAHSPMDESIDLLSPLGVNLTYFDQQ